MIRLFYYDSTWLNVDNDTDASALLDRGAVEYHADQIAGVEGNECNVSNDTMFQDDEGNWYFHMEETTEPVDIPALKAAKIEVLLKDREVLRNTERAIYDNDQFLIRQEDQNNMNTYYSEAIAMKMGLTPVGTFEVMSATDTPHTFTPDQIFELCTAMRVKVEEIYRRHWYAQNVLLANATTKAEIDAIQIPATLNT